MESKHRNLVLAAFLASLVAACGGSASSPGAAQGPTASSVGASSPSINIYAYVHGGRSDAIKCRQWIVIAGSRSAYTTAELQQMADFLVRTFSSGDDSGLPPPPTLQRTAVTIADPTAPPLRYWNHPYCSVELEITNTGQDTVLIPSAGLRLAADSTANGEAYHLVEACSIEHVAHYCGVRFGGGPTPCDFYNVQITLAPGHRNTDVVGTPMATQQGGSPCPPITLGPNKTVEISVNVSSAVAQVYPVEPVVVARTPSGTQTLAAVSLAGALKFASPSQFDCSQLQGQSLAAAWTGSAALDWDGLARQGRFCA